MTVFLVAHEEHPTAKITDVSLTPQVSVTVGSGGGSYRYCRWVEPDPDNGDWFFVRVEKC